MLKIKKIINYRQAKISRDGRDRNCGHCVNAKMMEIHNCGTSEKIGERLRCIIIGLRETRNAAIAINHICDRFIVSGTAEKCWHRGCKELALGFHCKSCNARVCKEHQAAEGYGNHGGLIGDIKIGKNEDWRRIK